MAHARGGEHEGIGLYADVQPEIGQQMMSFPALTGCPSLRREERERRCVLSQSGTATAALQVKAVGRGILGEAFCTMSASRSTVPDVVSSNAVSLNLPNSFLPDPWSLQPGVALCWVT
jgi:hypothetical protein